MVITKIIIVNVVIFLVNGLFFPDDHALANLLALNSQTIYHPLFYWKFLTYGFAHDPGNIMHIGGNMLSLFFLGYQVERKLGSREFLLFYLATIIFGGIAWSTSNINTVSSCWGASGGVVGVVILFALFFPRDTILFMFMFPIPAWALGVFIVANDILGAFGYQGHARVAYMVHIAGAAFAFMYYNYGWNFSRAVDRIKKPFSGPLFKRKPKKPKLNLYNPPPEETDRKKTDEEIFAEKVDEVLKKYARFGEGNLTEEERNILKSASERYKEKYKR